MTVTASAVASLTARMAYWEYAEYTFAVLVAVACFGEYIADFTKWWQRDGIWSRLGPMEDRKDNLGKLSTLLLITALVAETVCLFRTNQISGEVLGSLNELSDEAFKKAIKAKEDAGTAITQSGEATTKARSAEEASGRAVDKSGKAEGTASNAMILARGARQEADSYKGAIESAMKLANEAESHLNDALSQARSAAALAKGYERQITEAQRDATEAKRLLSEAQQLMNKAHQEASEATAGVNRLTTPRSLNQPVFVAMTRAFAGTEYIFDGVFGDEESIAITRQINSALVIAGWKRTKVPGRFPALRVFSGPDDNTDAVSINFATGIHIVIDSNDTPEHLNSLPEDAKPHNLKVAGALRSALIACISPTEDWSPRLLELAPGKSEAIKIIVGKKPWTRWPVTPPQA